MDPNTNATKTTGLKAAHTSQHTAKVIALKNSLIPLLPFSVLMRFCP